MRRISRAAIFNIVRIVQTLVFLAVKTFSPTGYFFNLINIYTVFLAVKTFSPTGSLHIHDYRHTRTQPLHLLQRLGLHLKGFHVELSRRLGGFPGCKAA